MSLQVCFNTIAILFLTVSDRTFLYLPYFPSAVPSFTNPSFYCLHLQDIDNISFAVGLSDAVRTRIEEAGAVPLDEAEASSLGILKDRHAYAIVIAIIGSLFAVVQTSKWGHMISWPFVAFGIAAAIEAASDTAVSRAKRVAVAVAQWFVGAVCFHYLMVMGFMAGHFMG